MPAPVPSWLRDATRSAIIVPVPETESLVTTHQRALNRTCPSAVPAHVTVLYPFVHPSRIDAAVVARVAEAVAGIAVFECAFARVRWFGDEVMWLQPDPDVHFRALTRAVCERFPDHPPYAGEHPETVPHLTVAGRRTGDLVGKRRAAAGIAGALPIRARIDRVRLVAGQDEHGPWRTVTEIPLTEDPVAPPAAGRFGGRSAAEHLRDQERQFQ